MGGMDLNKSLNATHVSEVDDRGCLALRSISRSSARLSNLLLLLL